MRILYVSKLAPQLGIRRVHEVGKRLVEMGHHVSVLSARTHQDQPAVETVDGMTVTAVRTAPQRLRTSGKVGFLATRLPFYLAAPVKVARLASRFDVVVEDVTPLRSPFMGLATRRAGVPLVLQVHSVFPTPRDWLANYGIKGIVGSFSEASLRRGRNVAAVYSDALWTVESLRRDLPADVITEWIPNGVDLDRFKPAPILPPGPPPLRLLAVGRLVKLKNLDTLVRAVAATAGDVRLTVVGDGPERAALDELVSSLGVADRVSLRGRVDEAELEAAYREAHVFVHPSTVEGMPLSVVEAMASGLPVVMSDIPAAAGVIRDDYGWLAKDTSVPAWTDVLDRLHTLGPGELATAGREARLRCEAEFNWDVVTERELALLERVRADHG